MKKTSKRFINCKYFMFYAICFMLYALCFMFHASTINAATMNSPIYQIEPGTITFDPQESAQKTNAPVQSISQADAAEFEAKGYLVKTGMPYLENSSPFGFEIDNTRINFGEISNSRAYTVDTTITVQLYGIKNYQVTSREESELKLFNRSITINDTTCSNFLNKCTHLRSNPWNSLYAYGFGYSLSGEGIPSDFYNKSYFRPFSNTDKNERPVIIMQGKNDTDDEQIAQLHAKLIISSTQTTGTYENVLTFIALPGF